MGIDLVTDVAPAHAAVIWGYPFTFRSTQSRGYNASIPHYGIDYTPGNGTVVHAAADGAIHTNAAFGNYGQHIVLAHADGYYSIYGHMQYGSTIALGPGGWVARGTPIGLVGSTGRSTAPHLHFEIRHGSLAYPGATVDPAPYVAQAPLANGSGGLPEPAQNTEIHRRNNNMSSLFYKSENNVTTFALAGDGVGSAAWLETTDQVLANQLAMQHGNAAQLTPASFALWKSYYKGTA